MRSNEICFSEDASSCKVGLGDWEGEGEGEGEAEGEKSST